MIVQEAFLKKYNIAPDAFVATTLVWADLEAIYNDYHKFREELQNTAEYLFNALMKIDHVHSVRYRIKDAEHLIDKIIRRRIAFPDKHITLENYKTEITDFIGLRALHLYKDEWENIHDYISGMWDLHEPPVANYRKGDSAEMTAEFANKGCKLNEHKYGYRSVHYLVVTKPAKTSYVAEIQVRTIFEEGWSEIDHRIRYPNDQDNKLLLEYLMLLNRLAGNADEMGSYIKNLKAALTERENKYQKDLAEKDAVITTLQARVSKLQIDGKQKEELAAEIEKLKSLKRYEDTTFVFKNGKLTEVPFTEAYITLPSVLENSFSLPKFGETKTFQELLVPDITKYTSLGLADAFSKKQVVFQSKPTSAIIETGSKEANQSEK